MKDVLHEYYDHSDDELRAFLQVGTIAVDANVLLSLYRVSQQQRDQIFDVLEKVSARVFVPYQVALEYQRNRLQVVSDQLSAHSSVTELACDKVVATLNDAAAALRKLSAEAEKKIRDVDVKASVVAEFDQTISDLAAVSAAASERTTAKLNELRDQHTTPFKTARSEDPVRARLDAIIAGDHIGKATDRESLKAEAQRRLDRGQPPGTKDKDKSDPTGDGIIWLELMNYAKESERRLLFVTDDQKADWYRTKIRGESLGPLVELRAEMTAETGQPYHQTTLDGFLRLANRFLSASVPEATIETIRNQRVVTDEADPNIVNVIDVRFVVSEEGAVRPLVLYTPIGRSDSRQSAARNWRLLPNVATLERSGIRIGDWADFNPLLPDPHSFVPLIESRDGSERPVVVPDSCPVCGTILMNLFLEHVDEPDLICPNEQCDAQRPTRNWKLHKPRSDQQDRVMFRWNGNSPVDLDD